MNWIRFSLLLFSFIWTIISFYFEAINKYEIMTCNSILFFLINDDNDIDNDNDNDNDDNADNAEACDTDENKEAGDNDEAGWEWQFW